MQKTNEPYALSRQERRVIALSMEGLGDKEVALAMDISLGTVRTYWKRIATKIGGHTRAEIVSTFARKEPEQELQRERDLVVRLQSEIAQRREAEERFRAICACSPVGIYVCDADGSCGYVNPAWERITGLDASRTMGQAWIDIVHPDDRQGLLDWWRENVVREPCEPTEFRFVTPQGEVWVRTCFAPMVIDGCLVGYVGTIDRAEAGLHSSNSVA